MLQPKPKLRRASGIRQAFQLQEFAFDAAMALKRACTDEQSHNVSMDVKTAVAVQKLIGAWDTASDRLRIYRNKGLPKVQEHKPKHSKAKTEPEPVTPLEAQRKASDALRQ
jgi:hypothetical protein